MKGGGKSLGSKRNETKQNKTNTNSDRDTEV